jgi:acetoin utilization deacetylase AcuC-like enzyme
MGEVVLFYPEGHAAHAEAGHPERPERVEVIRTALEREGLWDSLPRLEALEVPRSILEGVHSQGYLAALEQFSRAGRRFDADTYTTPASWRLALQAAGGAAAAAAAVWDRKYSAGYALTRPPGHHATRQRAMGFCLINNVAVAAEYLLSQRQAERLAVVDIDLHHGNGTQEIFWERRDVFYFSTHQYPHYPGTGSLEETGAREGHGTTANFPLPPGAGDAAFEAVMEKLILPLLDRYQPQMLLLSVGFDTHWRDPLGHLQLTVNGFARTVKALAGWAEENCQGRTALFLEGGYDLQAAAACSLAAVQVLRGQAWQDPLGPPPMPESRDWQKIVAHSQQIWGL